MSDELNQADAAVADAGIVSKDFEQNNLPAKKRKKEQESVASSGSASPIGDDGGPRKRGRPKGSKNKNRKDADLNSDEDSLGSEGQVDGQTAAGTSDPKPIKRAAMSKSREIRLEQNRKAARESRRRKKVMVEELQRSVIFFSRANGTLKQQNDELQQLLVQAQAQVQALEQNSDGTATSMQPNGASTQLGAAVTAPAPIPGDSRERAEVAAAPAADPAAAAQQVNQYQTMAQAQAGQATAPQAMYGSQGFPSQTYATGNSGVAAGSAPSPGNNEVQGAPPSNANAQQQLHNPQVAAALAANPFMAAMMGMMMPQNAAASAPAPGASAPGATLNPMDAFNQLAMQQQFAAQLGAMGGVMPDKAAAYPMLLQHQAAAMQLQMAAAAGGRWGAMGGSVQGGPAPAP